ncbi:MAG: YjbH domain-containing protein [Paracoccaceae bacterium]
MTRTATAVAAALTLMGGAAAAQDTFRNGYTLYGTAGLIDMPSAITAPDGEIAATLGLIPGQRRGSITFQIAPRLSGTFRYAQNADFIKEGNPNDPLNDRSFDLEGLLLTEGPMRPAVAVGLRDFAGTGIYSSEYLVATKHFGGNIRATAGIGWGRLGSFNGFDNPLGSGLADRPGFLDGTGRGGTASTDDYFRGDAALFGGVEYAVNPRLTLVAEYSSDAYVREERNGDVRRQAPVNLGVNYRLRDTIELGAGVIHGNDWFLSATFITDPNARPTVGGMDAAPIPVARRSAAAATWGDTVPPAPLLGQAIGAGLEASDGIAVSAVGLSGSEMRLRYVNDTYRSDAQAMGRISRLLTQVAPPSVDTFVLEPTRFGVPLSAVTIARDDMEALENEPGATAESLARARFDEARGDEGLSFLEQEGPRFTYGIAPSFELNLFDGEDPVVFNLGVEASATYRIAPNLLLAGSVRKTILDTRSGDGTIGFSALPPVRSQSILYDINGDPSVDYLTLTHYGRPAAQVYSRLTFGLLEEAFAGVSGEVLWKPVDSRLAVGAELNYVAQRDSDVLFGFDEFDYQVATGHVSAYYAFDAGYHAQLDVGRYLAGDVGATISIDREFANGWSVGAYATFTDVSAEDFGEGSFDKGLRFTIPIDYVLGTPNRSEGGSQLASLTRDGGARVNVDGRLYDIVRDGHRPQLAREWGRFWR